MSNSWFRTILTTSSDPLNECTSAQLEVSEITNGSEKKDSSTEDDSTFNEEKNERIQCNNERKRSCTNYLSDDTVKKNKRRKIQISKCRSCREIDRSRKYKIFKNVKKDANEDRTKVYKMLD